MSYNYDQTWPVEPRGRTPCPFCQGSQDVVASDAIQTWSRHKRWFKKGEMAFSVLIQVGISPLIMLYDPTHSAARQIPRVRLVRDPHHALTEMTVTTHPRATLSNTTLYPRPFTCSLHASMPCLRCFRCSLLQFARKRPASTPMPILRNRACSVFVLRHFYS